jgi:hypothetical protein
MQSKVAPKPETPEEQGPLIKVAQRNYNSKHGRQSRGVEDDNQTSRCVKVGIRGIFCIFWAAGKSLFLSATWRHI